VLASVRVEPAHGDAWRVEVTPQGGIGEPDHLEHTIVTHPCDCLDE
jgi:hypothetical protein